MFRVPTRQSSLIQVPVASGPRWRICSREARRSWSSLSLLVLVPLVWEVAASPCVPLCSPAWSWEW